MTGVCGLEGCDMHRGEQRWTLRERNNGERCCNGGKQDEKTLDRITVGVMTPAFRDEHLMAPSHAFRDGMPNGLPDPQCLLGMLNILRRGCGPGVVRCLSGGRCSV